MTEELEIQHKTTTGILQGTALSESIESGEISDSLATTMLSVWTRVMERIEADPSESVLQVLFLPVMIRHSWMSMFIQGPAQEDFLFSSGPKPDNFQALLSDTTGAEEYVETRIVDTIQLGNTSEEVNIYYQTMNICNAPYRLFILGLSEPSSETWDHLEEILTEYICHSGKTPTKQLVDFFEKVSAQLIEITNKMEKDARVSFAFLDFESMRKYVQVGGDFFAKEIVQAVKDTIAKFGEDVHCFPVSLNRYLVMVPEVESEELLEKFRSTSFYFRQVLLSYKVKLFTASVPITSMFEIWKEIMIR